MVKVCREALALVAAAALAGCSPTGGAHPTVQRADSAGVSIVTNTGPDHILEWRLEKLFELGGQDDGPESFFRLYNGAVAADSAGNLFVLDAASNHVAVFDPSGLPLRVMGREGEGPGEMTAPNSMAVDASGAAYVFDFRKGALVAFNPDGSAASQVPFQHFPAPFTKRHFAASNSRFLVLTLEYSSVPQRALKWLDAEAPVVAIDAGTNEMVMYECGVGLRLAPIFSPEILWDMSGDVVAFSSGPEYSIRLLNEDGGAQIIRRTLDPQVATPELAQAKLGEGMKVGMLSGGGRCEIPAAELVEGRGFALQVPVIENLALTPSSEVWVARTSAGPDPSETIDIFATDGTYTGTLAGYEMPLVFLPGDRIGLKETDQLDIDRLVIYQVIR